MSNAALAQPKPSAFDAAAYFRDNPSKCDASKHHLYSIDDARQLFGDKKIYLWGAGQKGRGFYLALKRCGFSVQCFLDSSAEMIGTEFMGVPVIHPNDLLDNPQALSKAFILAASVDSKNKQMFAVLEAKGLKKLEQYCSIQTLSPLYPTVEVTGLCNLRCSSCPRSDEELFESGKYMSAADYQKVINKMVAEIPFLYLVDLYAFGEPLLNKELPEIIEINNQLGLASGLSTNLNNIRNLEAVMAAFPAQIRISLSGMSKETYEVTHTGGKWDKVHQNLHTLGELTRKYNNRTIIEVYFHIYQHNRHELGAVKALCEQYGFRFHPSLAVLFSDYAMSFSETGSVPKAAQAAEQLMLLDMPTLIKDCQDQDHLKCILTRIVPVINWDLSVMPCCNYSYSGIVKNYLDVPLAEIINLRTNSDVCGKCQMHSLHRWNNQIAYSEFVKKQVDEYCQEPAVV